MPKDAGPPKRKAHEDPIPLFDSSTRNFLSTRISSSIVTASNVASRQFTVQAQIIPSLPRPLFGNFNEELYAMPDFEEPGDSADSMDVDDETSSPGVMQSGLPGIIVNVIKKGLGLAKRYLNSVCSPPPCIDN